MLKPLHREMNLLLFPLPMSRLSRPKFFGDFAFELIYIGLFNPMAHYSQTLLQPLALLLVGSENSEPLIPEILSRSALAGETSSKFR
jgi:hypothetical protein